MLTYLLQNHSFFLAHRKTLNLSIRAAQKRTVALFLPLSFGAHTPGLRLKVKNCQRTHGHYMASGPIFATAHIPNTATYEG